MLALAAGAMALMLATPAQAALATNGVVFNSGPDVLEPNYPSIGFEATQTSQFGDGIKFQPSAKTHLKNVKVVMSSWACQSGTWNTNDCLTTPGATYPMPITFNIYAQDTAGVPGALIATTTQTFNIHYRPSASAGCGGRWLASDGQCYNGFAQKITFNFATQHLVLPNSIVYGVAYNTSDYGTAPYGDATACHATPQGCFYDSLNVGAAAGIAKRGTDRYSDGVFQDSQTAGQYCDTTTVVTGVFRLDDGCWTGFNPMVRFLNQA